MPYIFLKSINKFFDKSISNNKGNIDYIWHYPPANIEWKNSVYAYNKSYIKHLPFIDKKLISLVNSYFKFFYPKYETIVNSIYTNIRYKRLSVNKIFVSKVEIKHTSTTIIITIFIYNRQRKYILNKLKTINTILETNNINLIKKIKLESINIFEQIKRENKFLDIGNKWDNYDIYKNYKEKLFEDFVKKSLEKEILKFFYDYLLFFNKSKFEDTYLLKFKDLISKFYEEQRKIEFNIVNLKYIHLNSDIFSEFIALKLRNRNNTLLRILKTSLNIIKLPYIDKLSVRNDLNRMKYNKLLLFNKVKYLNTLLHFSKGNKPIYDDEFDKLLKEIFPYITKNKKETFIQRSIFNCFKHKSISGIRLEAAGRLTRRLTAARSIFKIRNKGSLKNIDSSYKSYSSIILRGYLKSNIQYTNINSKTRNGSFGLKGWISSI